MWPNVLLFGHLVWSCLIVFDNICNEWWQTVMFDTVPNNNMLWGHQCLHVHVWSSNTSPLERANKTRISQIPDLYLYPISLNLFSCQNLTFNQGFLLHFARGTWDENNCCISYITFYVIPTGTQHIDKNIWSRNKLKKYPTCDICVCQHV